MNNNILFIGAHPDDVELGCGGTIMKHVKSQDNVFVIVATDGEVGKQPTDHSRLEESIQALKFAGVDEKNMFFPHLHDTQLFIERQQLLDVIGEVIESRNIDYIYTHSIHSYHQDHVQIYFETVRAGRCKRGIFTYETNGGTMATFSPNMFIDISPVYKDKLTMLKYFESQNDKYYFKLSDIESLAQMRGSQSKMFSFAEAFEVVKLNWKTPP